MYTNTPHTITHTRSFGSDEDEEQDVMDAKERAALKANSKLNSGMLNTSMKSLGSGKSFGSVKSLGGGRTKKVGVGQSLSWVLSRVGLNRIYTPHMTVHLVILLPKAKSAVYSRIYTWFWPTRLIKGLA